MGSSLHGAAGPGRSLLQHRLRTGSQPPSGIHLLRCGVPSMSYRWISAPLWTSLGCSWTACLTLVFSMGYRGIYAPVPGAPPPSPSSLALVSAELFLSHRFTPLTCRKCCYAGVFFLLKYIIPEVLPSLLMGLALASSGSILEPAGTGSIRHRGSFSQLLTEPPV